VCVALESPEGSLDIFYTFLSGGGARVHRLGEVSGHSQRRSGLTRGRDPLASECERGVFGASGLSVATTRRSRGFYPTIPVIGVFFAGSHSLELEALIVHAQGCRARPGSRLRSSRVCVRRRRR